jgi:hypothetical protein
MTKSLFRSLVLFLVVTSTGTAQQQEEKREIACPFIRAVDPDTTTWTAFIQDLADGGCSRAVCAPLAIATTQAQQGFLNASTFHVVDVTRLDEVPSGTKYSIYPDEVEQRMRQAATTNADGMITLQDLVDIKLWVAEQEGVDQPTLASKGETIVLFLRSGGDTGSWKVNPDNVLTLLGGTLPDDESTVGVFNVMRASRKADWTRRDVASDEPSTVVRVDRASTFP